jgi:RNA polymerase sigma-70 factor (ECF subfamily)
MDACVPGGEGQGAAFGLTGGGPDPAGALQRDESVAAVREAIARLPHDLMTTFLLHHYEGLSYGEIGAVLGCSERGVETRLYRARQRLRQWLAPHWRQPVPHADGE